MAHAWKACWCNSLTSSNLVSSAITLFPPKGKGLFHCKNGGISTFSGHSADLRTLLWHASTARAGLTSADADSGPESYEPKRLSDSSRFHAKVVSDRPSAGDRHAMTRR